MDTTACLAVLGLLLSVASGLCFQFSPGLCPGPSTCMCTLYEPCSSDAVRNLEVASAAVSGGCPGACRQVVQNECPGSDFCLRDAGNCSASTPSPIAPPSPTPPPGPPPSLIGMTYIPSSLSQGLAPFFIDQFESCVEYWDGGSWRLHSFHHPVDALDANNTEYRAVTPATLHSVGLIRPQAYISQAQGSKACVAAGKRLCTLAEYMSACSVNQSTYPYGNDYQSGACNEGHANPIVIIYGPNATWNLTEMNNPIIDTMPNTLMPGGAYVNCTNPLTKTYDMSGNLDEWVADVTEEGHGIFKGGYFVDASINGNGCRYETTAHAPTYHDYSLGFRCCYSSLVSP